MDRLGDWMQLVDGSCFYPLDPRPEDLDIEHIAHALSNICRFGGHTKEFYSVAQHSVLVSRQCVGKHALEGLMHDAAEAYLGDMIRPLKHRTALGYEYLKVERAVESCLASHFKLLMIYSQWPEGVKRADNILLATEARDVMSECQQSWTHALPAPLAERITPLAPPDAKRLFLDAYTKLARV